MFYGLVEGSVKIPGAEVPYAAFGKGQKNLILIPGLSVRDVKGAGASLAVLYRIFARDYRVYIFDRRTVVTEGLTNWDLAEDIAGAMDALGIEAADVLGISQGGMIAMALALEHPERVNRLVLGVTASRVNENLKRVIERLAACARNRDYIAINKAAFSLMYSEKYLKKYRFFLPLAVRLAKPGDFDRFAILASAILSFDCYDRLQEIQCPVLVLGADKDLITTGPASREIAERLNCEIHMYPEYGHGAYEEAMDFNSRAYTFLTQ